MAKQKDTKNFLDIIKDQRLKSKKEKFEGSFLEYLELVRSNPDIAKLSHKRLCDALEAHGISEMSDDD